MIQAYSSAGTEYPPAVPAGLLPDRAPAQRLRKGQVLRVQDDVQRVVGGLVTLNKAGDVTQDQVNAAERWYRDYVMGVIGARDPERKSSGKAPDIHAAMLSRTHAIGRCKFVREFLVCAGKFD